MIDVSDLLRDEADGHRWADVMLLLSMPRVTALLPAMDFPSDLAIPDLTSIAEECVREFERAAKRNWKLVCGAALKLALERLAALTDEGASARLASWVEETFPRVHSKNAQAFLWTAILRVAARPNAAGIREIQVSPPKQEVIVDAAKRALKFRDDVAKRIRDAEATPRTTWEAEIYSKYATDCSPLDHVADGVRGRSFREFWRRVSAVLEESERHEVVRWAKEVGAPAAQIPADLIEDPDPLA
jgi:hypothetical protein